MRGILLGLLIIFIVAHTACSYLTDFVVVNDSGQPLNIQFRVKDSRSLGENSSLAKIAISQLQNSDKQWQSLSPAEYQVDQRTGMVMVHLMPGEGLRIAVMHHYTGNPSDVENFPIEEITVAGASGELRVTGQQVLKAFSKVSMVLYTLTYS